MSSYIEYAIKASLCLAVVFLFYTLLLKNTTYYVYNRYFLLIFSILSFIIPLVNITVFMQAQQLDFIPFVNYLPIIGKSKIPSNLINNSVSFNYQEMILSVYIFVCSTLFVRLLAQILSIQKIRKEATLIESGKAEIYKLSKSFLPFSFLNSIFVNTNDYNQNELHEIIIHELVHVQQKHSVDILITEIICIINWFNPFARFIKKAIRENLEFIADDAVIQNGADRKNYQYLLLKVTGNISSFVASNFKFSSLKSRIRMMNKTRTQKLHLWKFLLLIPIVISLLFAFRDKTDISKLNPKETNTISKVYILSSLTYSIADKKVESVVVKEKENSLLKTGQSLNLENIFNEKARLKNLLEKNGFNNIGAHAINFMIDTTLGNNSFSIQVNINLAKDELSKTQDEQNHSKINTQFNVEEKSIQRPVSIKPSDASVSDIDEFSNKMPLTDNKLSSIK